MPLHPYGVLTGRPIQRILGTASSPHYQIRVVDDTTDYRVAINVRSQDRRTPDLLFHIDTDFQHPITSGLTKETGFRELSNTPDGGGLDFIRGNLMARDAMSLLGEDDLNDAFERIIQPAMSDENNLIYAFGDRWGPEDNKKDQYFGFLPGNGVHDIHMNQGNEPAHRRDDGVWQDGGLIVHFPAEERWTAVFLGFQSQSWHTDDETGHAIEGESAAVTAPHFRGRRRRPVARTSGGHVKIVAARVHQGGPSGGNVTLLNISAEDITLDGWALADRLKRREPLHGTLAAGQATTVHLHEARLEPSGGLITLLDNKGLKVTGVAYTSDQVSRQGWSVVF